jgi:fumarylpyruvate hydrolase
VPNGGIVFGGSGADRTVTISPTINSFGTTTITLKVNGTIRQQSDLSQLIWNVPEIIAHLSAIFELKAGDLIMTGTPAGVAAVKPGDVMEGHCEGLGSITTKVV